MLGLELPHAVRVQHVVEGDPQQVLPRVAQVTLTAATKKYLKPCLTDAPLQFNTTWEAGKLFTVLTLRLILGK